MKRYLDILKNVSLFRNIEFENLAAMLSCLGTRKQEYEAGCVIILAGDKIQDVGIVIKGTIQIIKEDIMGNRAIIAKLNESDIFSETLACANVEESPVTVMALTPATVLFISVKRIVTTCSSSCVFHTTLVSNLLKVIAEKNIYLTNKMNILSQRTIREKILTYLTTQADNAGSLIFTIPFNRGELADFLSVDRSALSRELANMQALGLIDYHKNDFKLL
ncbi:MAG: Crp/Fnr family transcriptional regulator [Clostridia bacterium]|nr:Crp/Fnr family transcriptional regulator [Clostridia bacterium]MDD4571486.1 Crp/Fnr family transcriptional regulator [Clostridia bacterium]